MKKLFLTALALAISLNVHAAPDAAQVKAVHDLLQSMQAEKLMRMKAGSAHYANEKQRADVTAKIDKVAPETIYTRLATPVAAFVSTETATEMARFYQTPYGKKIVFAMYNGGPAMYGNEPKPTPAEAKEMKKPAFVKADKEFKAAEQALHHEAFLLVNKIANEK